MDDACPKICLHHLIFFGLKLKQNASFSNHKRWQFNSPQTVLAPRAEFCKD